MRKATINGQSFVCIIFSFFGLINHGVWIWMSGKTGQKKQRLAGIVSLIVCLGTAIMLGNVKDEIISTIVMIIFFVSLFAPTVGIFMNLNTFKSCQSLWSLIKKYKIRVDLLPEDAFSGIQVYPSELTLKSSQRLFGDKSGAILRAIQFKEWESREMEENKKRETERLKEEARMVETEKVKAEAEKMRAEAEVKRLEAERLREETKKIEAERTQVEAQKLKAETERIRAEEEMKRLEMERACEDKERKDHEKQLEEKRTVMKTEQFQTEIHPENAKKVDINSCTEQELSLVPGVGIILAKKAVRIRSERGIFNSVDEFIREVGIRGNNEAFVRKNLICTQSTVYIENSAKKHGRKIDL